MTALACGGVRKTYGAFVALDDVEIAVDAGEILGLAGPNGAGKTTLFDVLSGRVHPDHGSVTLGERSITSLATHRRARLGLDAPSGAARSDLAERRRHAARARDDYNPRVTPDTVAHARELVGLAAPDRALAGGLDTLERRKLLLACLLQRPLSVLLMDEPCSGLLADEIDEIDAVIRRIVEELGCAVIVVEHRLELLFAIAKRVVVLDAGSVIAAGPAGEVFELPIVRKAYFEDAGEET
jgi:ABC-type branched-subunit amino acid transport system ATPase component